jgi:hypothetical protein
VNCLLLERGHWNDAFNQAAGRTGIATLGVVHPDANALEVARSAGTVGLSGVVLEGNFEPAMAAKVKSVLADSRIQTIQLPARSQMRLDDSSQPIVGTFQGVWPGIQVQESGSTKAAPSGAPWIDTNTGFLRFVRAATDAPLWIGYLPPAKTVLTPERYMQAVADASMVGARWIIALDEDFSRKLLARDNAALKAWQRIAGEVAYYESHKDWRGTQPLAQLALVQDADSGALLSGGILDMIAVKHTPVRPVPKSRLNEKTMSTSKLAVDVDPSTLSTAQKDVLKNFTRGGGTLLTGPPGWKFPALPPDQITLGDKDVKILDDIWKEMNSMTGRRNLGARLFNVSSMLSSLTATADGKQSILQLVNYSGYPVENITVHMLGSHKRAKLYAPGIEPKELTVYEVEEGTGIDVDKVDVSATLVVE